VLRYPVDQVLIPAIDPGQGKVGGIAAVWSKNDFRNGGSFL